MESAKRRNRIHHDEERIPGNKIFRSKGEVEEQLHLHLHLHLRQQRKKQLQLQKKTQIPFGDDNEKEKPRSFAGPFCERVG